MKKVKFAPLQKSIGFKFDDLEILLRKPKELPSILQSSKKSRSQLLVEVLASCHSLMIVKGELVGDPLDIKMFQFSGWAMEQNEVKTNLFLDGFIKLNFSINMIDLFSQSSDPNN